MRFVIIPSAKLISEDLQSRFGKIPMALVPINGVCILEILYEQYLNNVHEIIVVAKEGIEDIKKMIELNQLRIKVIETDQLLDVGYSVKAGLEHLIQNYDTDKITNVIINLADTFIEDLDISSLSNTLIYSKTTDFQRWTTFTFSSDKLVKIFDKKNREIAADYYSFAGVYSFSNIQILFKMIKIELNEYMDSFYNAILTYNDQFSFEFIITENWRDLGHLDNYISSKREVNSRYFNRIEVDRERGILRKTSTEESKFKDEILWYLKLPANLQYLCPRIFEYSLEYGNMSVSMEYYGYNSLNELLVFGNLNYIQWSRIFHAIFHAIDDFNCFTISEDRFGLTSSLSEMYYDKTMSRVDKIRKDENFLVFFTNNIIINNNKYESLDYYINKIDFLISKYNLLTIDKFSIIHGDLCFSNILYDSNSNLIRLIDPRGKFGKYDIYGDSRYDLAKLSHSVNGGYDFIINDLFKLNLNNNNINFEIEANQNTLLAQKILNEHIKGDNLNQIKLIEGLLFLSMIPLHQDFPKRQLVMMTTAIQIFDILLKKGY